MPDFALFVTGALVTLVVAAGCFKLGRAEEEEARKRENQRQLARISSR